MRMETEHLQNNEKEDGGGGCELDLQEGKKKKRLY